MTGISLYVRQKQYGGLMVKIHNWNVSDLEIESQSHWIFLAGYK